MEENKNSRSMSIIKEYSESILAFLKAAFVLSLLFGSLLLGFYFGSVGFLPYFKISEFPFVVIFVFVLGLLMVLFLSFFLIFPVYFLKTQIEILEKDAHVDIIKRLQGFDFCSLIFHFGPPALFVVILSISLLKNFSNAHAVRLILTGTICLVYILFVLCIIKIINKASSREILCIKIKGDNIPKWKIFWYLLLPSLYYTLSLWIIFLLYYEIIVSSPQIPFYLVFLFIFFIYALVSLFSFGLFNFSGGKQLILLLVFFGFLAPVFILFFFGKANILYLKPIQLLKLGQVEVELYLKQSDEDDKSKECKGDQKSICGTLLFRDSNFYYIEPKSCNRKEGNKAKSNNQIQQEKVVESSNQAESDNQTNSDNQTKPKNVEKIIKKVPSAEVDRVIFYKIDETLKKLRKEINFYRLDS